MPLDTRKLHLLEQFTRAILHDGTSEIIKFTKHCELLHGREILFKA